MFDDTKEPVDIFADVDKPAPARASGMPGASAAPTMPQYAAARGPSKLLLGLIGLVVLLAAGGGAYFFLNRGPADQPSAAAPDETADDGTGDAPEPEASPPPEPEPEAPPPVEQPVITPPPEPEAPVTPPEPATAPSDADGDGLTDDEENQIGTDPQAVDTDSDGLTDKEEVGIYKTDPLKPDTDGDGYLDGQEVKGGYNPNGPGKLFELPPKP